MFRTDSIYTEPIVPSDTNDTIEHQPAKPQTPYQVLRLLPKDATPAQQDSAIQAWFQPGEIHYSSRPDTLHLPGHDIGKSLKDVNLPQYYREHFFSNNSFLHPELDGGRFGVAGDPIPYSTKNDNIITSMGLVVRWLEHADVHVRRSRGVCCRRCHCTPHQLALLRYHLF